MSKNATTIVIALLLAILIVLGVNALQAPRQVTVGDRVDATIERAQDDIQDAAANSD